jgi:endoglucanase
VKGGLVALLACAGCSSSSSPQADSSVAWDAAGDATLDDLLVDDFDDGDGRSVLLGEWYAYDDSPDGGKSNLAFAGAAGSAIAMGGAGFESQKCLSVSYRFDKGTYAYEPYVGLGVSLASGSVPYDVTAYAGIAYTYKGDAHRVRVDTSDVKDYDYYGVQVPASPTWTTVSISFDSLFQAGWGKSVAFDPKHVVRLSFEMTGSTGQTGTLDIDDLKIVRTAAKWTKDMVIQPASPPADEVVASIAIPNPLQAKAVAYLSRGYNFTDWLESTRFTEFRYDETTVRNLAQAGFKSLRLPINLDLYVASSSGTGGELSITLGDDLFRLLDSFNTWTKAHGMSLTIDYHKYTSRFDLAKPDTVATAIQVWAKVAEHFAAEPREDLFYELLNETELSFTGTLPTQEEWTGIAERMIAAIRAVDTSHTVIFGDVQWYGIDKLCARTPLSDSNVIYAFHDYDPEIFTHQGATWDEMGSSHGIPYPYSPERWSTSYADFGFSRSTTPSWILNQAQSYYINGTRAAIRNRIVKAKRWAVKNNVPVICNEFGAYDAASKLDDRVRYYTDVVGIFDELSIPWQSWFMTMDSAGALPAGYATAMGLK